MNNCEICGHKEEVHYNIKDETGEHCACKECGNTICF